MNTYAERMAIRTGSDMRRAQLSFDGLAEPEASPTESGLIYLQAEAEELIGRAERCMQAGDMQTAIDLYKAAGDLLCGADWAEAA